MAQSSNSSARGKWLVLGLLPPLLLIGIGATLFWNSRNSDTPQTVGTCRGEKLLKKIEIRFSQEPGQNSNATEMEYEGQTLFVRNDLSIENNEIDAIEDVVDNFGAPNLKFHLNAQGTVKLSQGMKESYGRNLVILVDGSIHATPLITGQIPDGKPQISLVKMVGQTGKLIHFSSSDLCSSR